MAQRTGFIMMLCVVYAVTNCIMYSDLLPTVTLSQGSVRASSSSTGRRVPVIGDFIERDGSEYGTSMPVYMAIPSVPRAHDKDYLLQVLHSLRNSHFPASNTFVFYNTNGEKGHDNNNHTHMQHMRWNQAFDIYAEAGVKFVWNNKPTPPAHPSAYNSSMPLPENLEMSDTLEERWDAAQGDSVSRKDWRRKECFDFLAISKYMLAQVGHHHDNYKKYNNHEDPDDQSPPPPRTIPWIIFNQDDGVWTLPFYQVYSKLQSYSAAAAAAADGAAAAADVGNITSSGIVDLRSSGLVSVAFPVDILIGLVKHGELWCDYIPVDWMIDDYIQRVLKHKQKYIENDVVKHIGDVSSKVGRIQDLQER